MKKAKTLIAMLCVGLACTLGFNFIFENKPTDTRLTRTVEVGVDHMMLLQEFDSYTLETTDTSVSLNVASSLPIEMFSEIDLLALGDEIDLCGRNPRVYISTYFCIQSEQIRVTATMVDFAEDVIVETIVGNVFFDENGNPDVVFNIDGQLILLSDIVGGAVEDLFFFTKIIVGIVVVTKKVGTAAVVTVKVGAPKLALIGGGKAPTTGFAWGASVGVNAQIAAIIAAGLVITAVMTYSDFLRHPDRVALDRVRNELQQNRAFPAKVINGAIWVIPIPINNNATAASTTVSMGRQGGTFTRTQPHANTIARLAFPGGVRLHPPHGFGFLPHYQCNLFRTNGHVWFI